MNKNDRKILKGYIDQLEETQGCIEEMRDSEEEKYDNLPEGIQDSERWEAIQNAIDALDGAYDSIGDAIDYLNEAIE